MKINGKQNDAAKNIIINFDSILNMEFTTHMLTHTLLRFMHEESIPQGSTWTIQQKSTFIFEKLEGVGSIDITPLEPVVFLILVIFISFYSTHSTIFIMLVHRGASSLCLLLCIFVGHRIVNKSEKICLYFRF